MQKVVCIPDNVCRIFVCSIYLTCYLIVQMVIYCKNSYLGHILQNVGENLWFLSTVSTPLLWLTATHSPQNIRLIRAGAVPTHNPRKRDNSASYCNSRFSNIDGDKEQNLRTADLRTEFFFGVNYTFKARWMYRSCTLRKISLHLHDDIFISQCMHTL